jgi:hypothetical protein
VQLPPLFYEQPCFPRAGVSSSGANFYVPFFLLKRKEKSLLLDGLMEVCLPLVLKSPILGETKEKKNRKMGEA